MNCRATAFALALLLSLGSLWASAFALAPAGDVAAAAAQPLHEPGRSDGSPAAGAAETAADAQALPGAGLAALPLRAATPNPQPHATSALAAPFLAVPKQPPRRTRAID